MPRMSGGCDTWRRPRWVKARCRPDRVRIRSDAATRPRRRYRAGRCRVHLPAVRPLLRNPDRVRPTARQRVSKKRLRHFTRLGDNRIHDLSPCSVPVRQILQQRRPATRSPAPGDRHHHSRGEHTTNPADCVNDRGEDNASQDAQQDLRVRGHSVQDCVSRNRRGTTLPPVLRCEAGIHGASREMKHPLLVTHTNHGRLAALLPTALTNSAQPTASAH